MRKDYWNEEIKDIVEGVTFKVIKTNPVDMIQLLTASLDYETSNGNKQSEFVTKCLQQFIWTKTDGKWYPLLDADGNSRLQDYIDNPLIAFDLFMYYRSKVIMPLFTESKTYQRLMSRKESAESKEQI